MTLGLLVGAQLWSSAWSNWLDESPVESCSAGRLEMALLSDF